MINKWFELSLKQSPVEQWMDSSNCKMFLKHTYRTELYKTQTHLYAALEYL